MNIRILTSVTLLLFLASCINTEKNKDKIYTLSKADQKEITNTLYETQDAWNTGDLEGFMEGYWKSDKLVFIGVQGPNLWIQ